MALEMEHWMPWLPALPLAGAVLNGLFGHRLPRALVGAVACGAVLGAALLAIGTFLHVRDSGELAVTLYSWIPTGGLDLDVRFLVDPLSAVMILVITCVGFLIHVYSWGYMAHEPSLARYYAYLNLFTFAMLVLVLADSLPLLFVGWEGVGLCSYLLIGFWYQDSDKASAGKKAFIVNRIGDFGFIVAMLLLFRVTGSLSIPGLEAAVAGGKVSTAVATGACLMLLLGATGKSAQIPLYVWLPDAMAGPTPVSALIHAATMVTAGVYLTCRMGFLFTLAPAAMLAMAIIGAATALFAASIATAQTDIKKVLAYSTISQLGFMFIAAGVGAYAVALFHVVTHAFFKACLFLGAGSVIHATGGEQDMTRMGGLWRRIPWTFATYGVATLAITGFPLLSGFISKDAILWSAWSSSFGAHAETFAGLGAVLWGVGVCAAGLTSFYMWRSVGLTFFSGPTRLPADRLDHVHESPPSMTVPLVLLATASVVGGALSWPHLFGGHDALVHGWLAKWMPAAPEGDHAATEWGLMVTSTALAALGLGVAWVLYGRAVHPFTSRFASHRQGGWLVLRLREKWHIDELYDAVVVRPIVRVSKVVLYEGIDARIIDGSVNAVGWVGRKAGFVGQVFQSGNIQRYIAIFAIGLAVLLYGWLTPYDAPGGEPGAERAAAEAQPGSP